MTPERFDDLAIERTLGSGAFGTVYLAHDALIGRKVALKVIESPETGSEDAVLREARLVGGLVHPNVVTLHRVRPPTPERPQWGFEFEYVDGGTLRDLLEEEKRLPPEQAAAIARGVTAGLAAAHEQGVVHGDVKPGNILIAGDGAPKLADFGLGRLISDLSLRVSQSGGGVGTPAFMAPEVMLGERPSPAADIWSLGVVIYRLTAGRLPFTGTHLHNLIYAIQNLEPPPPPGDTPPEQVTAMRACLAKRPEDRPQNAGEVLKILEGAASAPPRPRREIPILTTLRGRADEIRRLRARVEEAETGDGSCTLVVGAPGAGKSALVAETARYAATREVPCVMATASALEGVVRPLLRALSSATREGDAGNRFESSREAIEHVLDASAQLRMDTSQPALVTLERTLRGILEDSRLCMVIEDLHEGDPDDLRFTLQLVRNMSDSGAAVILTVRDSDEGGLAHLLGAETFVQAMPLGLLTEEDAYALLEDHAGARVEPVIADRVFSHARGNPRFSKELFRHMLDREAIVHDGDRVLPGPAWGSSELPRRFRDLVTLRLRDLSPEERELLDVAAVAGDEFDGEDVASVLGRPVLEVLRSLQHLYRDHHLVAPTREGYRFVSPIIRTVIYRELAASLRRALHRALAERVSSRPHEDPERIAGHWGGAGEEELARPFFLEAARAAARRMEPHRAIRLAERGGLRAEELTPGLAARNPELLLALVLLHEQTGNTGDAARIVDALLATAKETGDNDLRLRALTRRADSLYRTGGAPAVDMEVLEEASRRLPPCLERATAAYLLGLIEKFRGNLEQAETHLEQSLDSLRSFPHDGVKGMVLDQLASLALRRGMLEEAERLYRESASLSEGLGRRAEAAVSGINAALAAFRRGAFDGLRDSLARAIRRLELANSSRIAAHARLILAEVLYAEGDRENAEVTVDEALVSLADLDYFLGLGDGLVQKAALLFVSGRYSDAIQVLDEAIDLGEGHGYLQVRCMALGWRCKCRCALGEIEAGRRDADRCLELARGTEDESIRNSAANLIAEAVLLGLPAHAGLAPLLSGDPVDPREAAVAAIVDVAAIWSSTAGSGPLRRAAAALRHPDLGERQAEQRILASWIEAEAQRRDGHVEAAARTAGAALPAAERLGHAWYVQALRQYR